MEELRKYGTFEGGVYRRNEGVPGKRNMDRFEAIWSHVNGRKLEYPKPRYPGPIMMDRDNFGWVPAPGQPGVSEKPLGVFTERRTEAGFVKLDPGASYTGSGRGIYVCYAGKGQVESEPLRPVTTVFLDHGEHATFTAEEATELVHFGLPDLRDLALTPEAHAPAVAAE
jgi:hypothetical protein